MSWYVPEKFKRPDPWGVSKWSDEDRARIISLKGKRTATDIAAEYGVGKGAIVGIWFRAVHPRRQMRTAA